MMSLETYYLTLFGLISVGALAIMLIVSIQDRHAKRPPTPPVPHR